MRLEVAIDTICQCQVDIGDVGLEYPSDTKSRLDDRRHQIENVLNEFVLTDDDLRAIMQILSEEMDKGLKSEGVDVTLKMLPSYVTSVPNGSECGNFLALDLGGTNFRVLLIKLDGNKRSEMSSKIYHVPHDLMVGDGISLFDHIASCLSQFMTEQGLINERLSLGFTFSFPCFQQTLTSGQLINWTKGFKCTGVEGQDVVKLLQEAVHRRSDIAIDVVALLNDTVGTLMALGYTDGDCQVGVIVGTGTNACYVEKVSQCPKLSSLVKKHHEMIINTEWGAFGDNGRLDCYRNVYDNILDQCSINAGKQIFEKAISGMYMGELVRLVLRDLHTRGLLFEGKCAKILSVPNQFPTKYVSEIVSDTLERQISYDRTLMILTEMGIAEVAADDCAIVSQICSMVSNRAAHLCAAGIAVLLNRMKKPKVTVGMDGSVYRFHPTFKMSLENKIDQLLGANLMFELKLSEDGSGRGAALVAAVAYRMENERR